MQLYTEKLAAVGGVPPENHADTIAIPLLVNLGIKMTGVHPLSAVNDVEPVAIDPAPTDASVPVTFLHLVRNPVDIVPVAIVLSH